MRIPFSVAAALLVIAAAVPAQAQRGGYAAVPLAAPKQTRFIAGSVAFGWADTAYVASGTGSDRPAIMCELVARQVGKLASFSAGGTALDPAALEKCNAKAR